MLNSEVSGAEYTWICQASVPLRGTKPLSTMGFMLCPTGYLLTP